MFGQINGSTMQLQFKAAFPTSGQSKTTPRELSLDLVATVCRGHKHKSKLLNICLGLLQGPSLTRCQNKGSGGHMINRLIKREDSTRTMQPERNCGNAVS